MKSKCVVCGLEFDITPSKIKNGRGKYCSKVCKYKSKKVINNCQVCGKETTNTKYCSTDCRNQSFGRILKTCEVCGKEYYGNRKKFCSKQCYTIHQIKIADNDKKICPICNKKHTNIKYCSEQCQYEGYKKEKIERIVVSCLCCGKEIRTTTHRNTKYCDKSCKDEHQKTTYLGSGNPMYGLKLDEKTIQKHSQIALELWKDPIFVQKVQEGFKRYNLEHDCKMGHNPEAKEKRKNTLLSKYGTEHNWQNIVVREKCDETCITRHGEKSIVLAHKALLKKSKTSIENKLENFLIENNINYKPQYYIYYLDDNGKTRYKRYDFLLTDYQIIVETDGDYWHGNPLFFDKLNETQIKNIENDVFKTALAEYNGLSVIRFWENEIKQDKHTKILDIIYES